MHNANLHRAFSGPMAITAEALNDLRERMVALAANAPLMATVASGKWRAEEPTGAVAGTGGLLRVEDGIGVISVRGPLFKLSESVDDQFRLFFGCTAYDDLWRSIEECQSQRLRGAMMRFNSPGGDVGGCGEFADHVYSLRGKFRVRSYVETQCASAAQWIGAQTEHTTAHETALSGWVGVIRGPLIDDSAMLEKLGIKVHEIVSKHAKAKRSIPLDDEVLARFQVMADDLGDRFEEAVARGRGIRPAEAAERFGGGDGLIAQKALAAGLIDKVGSFNSAMTAFREALAPSMITVPVSLPAPQPAARAKTPQAAHRKEKAMPKSNPYRSEADDEKKKGDAKRAEAEGKRAKADAKRADAKKAEAEADDLDGDEKKDEAKAKRAEAKRCEAEADEMESNADMLDAEADEMDAEHEEPDGDEARAMFTSLARKHGLPETASRREILLAASAAPAPAAVSATVEKLVEEKFAAAERARAKSEAKARAEQLAAAAVRGGYDAQDKKHLVEFATVSYDAAARSVAHFVKKDQALAERFTHAGGPAGSDRPVASGDIQVRQMGGVKIMKHGCSLSAEAKALAKKDKITYEAALDRVVAEKPELYAAYLENLS